MWNHALFRPILAIGGLSYLVAVVMGNIMFDLLGDSETARVYYCGLSDAALSNPLRLLPIAIVIVITAVTLAGEAKAAVGTSWFLPELSILSAMVAVQLPLFGKCLHLQVSSCASGTSGWSVHKNLLMSHVTVLLILCGTIQARLAVLFYRHAPRLA